MTDSKYLPAFNGWLRTMGEDVLSLANLLEAPDAPAPFRQASAESLHYLLRSAELIPEGLEALGYLEGAFAFRVIAERALVDGPEGRHPDDERGTSDEPERGGAESGLEAMEENPSGSSAAGSVEPSDDEAFDRRDDPVEPRAGREPVPTEGRVPRLAADVALIREFLGEDMPRLLTLALAPRATTRAGRAAAELLEDDELRSTTLRDARQWVERYRAPELRTSGEELVKLGSFFRTRLRPEP